MDSQPLLAGEKQYAFHHLSVEDGLPNASVLSIAEDSLGFIWFGTVNGLSRYEGFEFINFNLVETDGQLKSVKSIHQIVPINKGNLWIVSNTLGLLQYDVLSQQIKEITHERDTFNLIFRKVSTVFQHASNLIYLGTRDGKLYSYEKGKGYLNYIGKLGTGNDVVSAIEFDDFGNMWVGSNYGLYKWNGKDQFVKLRQLNSTIENIPGEFDVKTIFSEYNRLWIGTVTGLFRLDVSGTGIRDFNVYQNDPNNNGSLIHNVIRDISKCSNGNLLFATGNGIAIWDGNIFQGITRDPLDLHSLNDRYIYAIHYDSRGNLWAGSYFGGVNVSYKSLEGMHVFKEDMKGERLRGRIVKTFLETDNEIWIGTEDNGISIWNRESKQWNHLSAENGLANNNVQSIIKDRSGRIWIGHFRGGVSLYEGGDIVGIFKNDPENPGSLSSNVISFIYEDQDGEIWVGTYNRGLNLFDPETNKFIRIENTYNEQLNIISMVPQMNGFLVFAGNGIVMYLEKNSLKTNIINWVQESVSGIYKVFVHDDEIWFGTAGDGLIIGKLENNKLSIEKKLFSFDIVNNIIKDLNGNMWVLTAQSLYKLDENGNILESIHQHHGLWGSFNKDAGLLLSSGEIILGGINGFGIFSPYEIDYGFEADNLILKNLLINYQTVNTYNNPDILEDALYFTSSVSLKHNQNNISIDFLALRYGLNSTQNYFYRLIGLQNEWVSNGNSRSVTFNNLRPGEYVFEVITHEARFAGLEEMKRTLVINIKPPWWRTIYAYSGYIIIVVLILYLFHRYSMLLAEKKNLLKMEKFERENERELYESKLKFFTNISHEIRTPLTLIIGPLEEYIEHSIENNKSNLTLNIIRKNAYRLLHLVNQILDFRKYDNKMVTLNQDSINITEFLNGIKDMFSEAARVKSINMTLSFETEDLVTIGDKAKLEEVFFNLLSNALKYTPQEGRIDIHIKKRRLPKSIYTGISKRSGEMICVKIKDSGVGIPKTLLKDIFTPFYSDPSGSGGYNTGIGLALVREIVELHNGVVTVESNPGEGASFYVYLPSSDKIGDSLHKGVTEGPTHFPAKSKPDPMLWIDAEKAVSVDQEPFESDKPVVLIAEDNKEMREFIAKSLQEQYYVIQAEDGEEALSLAKSIAPDLIISDVQMPKMDGMNLCKTLKGHFSTADIPVILLTVHRSFEKQMEGVCTGADLYLTKPFHADLLREWVKNILTKREKITEKIRHDFMLEPSEPESSSLEDMFLNEVKSIMEKHISNSDFSVDNLADELAVSRTVMYRKFKQVLGLSPKDFIRQTRLKRAAQLLRIGEMNVSEITYAVGYNDLRYFRESFFKHYGVNPSEFLEKKEENP